MFRPTWSWIVLPFVAFLVEVPAPHVTMARERGALEIGMDGFVGGRLYDQSEAFVDDVFYVNMPVASIRVGMYLDDRMSLEPGLGWSLINIDGETLSELDFDLSLLYSLADPSKTAPYIRVGGGVVLVNSDLPASTQFSAGVALGVRIPAGDRFAVRLQGGVDKNFEGDFIASTDVGAKIGLSFFTR